MFDVFGVFREKKTFEKIHGKEDRMYAGTSFFCQDDLGDQYDPAEGCLRKIRRCVEFTGEFHVQNSWSSAVRRVRMQTKNSFCFEPTRPGKRDRSMANKYLTFYSEDCNEFCK